MYPRRCALFLSSSSLVPGELSSETIARLIARHGSLEAARVKALQDPRFEGEFRQVILMQQVSRTEEANRAWTVEFWQLVDAWDQIDDEPPAAARPDGLVADVAEWIARGRPTSGELTQRAISRKHGVSRRQVRKVERELTDG